MTSVFSVRALLFILLINFAASAQSVGDIAFDARTDDPKFQLCNPEWVWQGYQLKTKMDETPLVVSKELKSKYQPRDSWKNESGIIRVRFIVNCSGVADRFRLLELGFDLKERQFNEGLKAHVLKIAKEIQWPVRRAHQQTVDYYYNFAIRITNGQLTDIIL